MTFDHCIASPLARARQTVEIIARALNMPLEFDDNWKEINNGLLAGLNDAEATERVPRLLFLLSSNQVKINGQGVVSLAVFFDHAH